MEGIKQEQQAVAIEARNDAEILTGIGGERDRLLGAMKSRADALIKDFPLLKGRVTLILEKASVNLRLVVGASVLAVASQGAFAQQGETENTQIDTPETTSESMQNKEEPLSFSEIFLEQSTPSHSGGKAEGYGQTEDTYPDTDISDVERKSLEHLVAEPEDKNRHLPKQEELGLKEQLQYAIALCMYSEEAADCASAYIQAVVHGKQVDTKKAFERLAQAETVAEKKAALEHLFRALPFLGPAVVEKIYNKIPLIDALGIAPNVDGTTSKAGNILVKRVHSITDETSAPEKKVSAGIDIATDTPLLSRILVQKNPLVLALGGIKDVYEELKQEKPDPIKIAKAVGKFALNKITFGLGSFIIDNINNLDDTKSPKKES